MNRFLIAALACSTLWACGAPVRGNVGAGNEDAGNGNGGGDDLYIPSGLLNRDSGGGPGSMGCEAELQGCYTVYAHSDHVLYRVDLTMKSLITIGPFHAQMVMGTGGKMVEDTIQDLGVATDGTIYVISRSFLYVADPKDGHVTVKGSVQLCGTDVVALTLTPDDKMYAADFKGAFCRIDNPNSAKPTVVQLGMLGQGLAISGDIVAVADGTIFGTAYKIVDGNKGPTGLNNLLVTIDPKTGAVIKTIGSTGFPKLFGIAFEKGLVFGFTHDGSGDVITIDPKTGKGTLYNSFLDMTMQKISFAGAGVNANVAPPPVM